MATRIKTMTDLRNEVLETLERVKADPKYAMQAHEVGNLTGKTVSMCSMHLKRCLVNKCRSEGAWDAFISG